jgi:hypothetical protein
MTITPKLSTENIDYVFSVAGKILSESSDRLPSTPGEAYSARLIMNELKNYCDETREETFTTNLKVGTYLLKILCFVLIISSLIFKFAVKRGSVIPVCICTVLSILIFSIFAYKFFFDGKVLDNLFPRRNSINIFAKRYSHFTAQNRVVLVARADAPKKQRFFLFKTNLTTVLLTLSVIGNTFTFISCIMYLFTGAPESNAIFSLLASISVFFSVFYLLSILLVHPNKSASGLSSSIIPAATITAIMKQMSENNFRYNQTEFCCLITGSEYSNHAGAYAFAAKYKKIMRDIPTVFIPVEELTSSKHLAIFFKDGSGNEGSKDTANIMSDACDNLSLKIHKESTIIGTSSFTPFTVHHFASCSLGTSKKYINKCFSNKDLLSNVSRKTIFDSANILMETANYYDNARL